MPSRYILEGIASDLAAGAEIIVFIPKYSHPSSMIHLIMEYTDETYAQVNASSRTITHDSGGRITVCTDDRQAHGLVYDVIVVPYGSASEFPFFLDPRVEIIEY